MGFSVAMAQRIELWPLDRLQPYERNARTHSPEQVAKIAASITEFGFNNPILVDTSDGIIAGHGRLMAARELGLEAVPVVVLDHLTDAQRRAYILADNRLAEDAGWDDALLGAELAALQADGFDLELTGFTDEELEDLLGGDGGLGGGDGPGDPYADGEQGALSERYGAPPFSVLDAKQGRWQERKREWLALGIRSELGRSDRLLSYNNVSVTDENDTSVFDPVLCELAYRWFSPRGGVVLDPFAGGSVRGVVASRLGRQYVGVELRPEQVEANRQQAMEICTDPMPVWHCGDSRGLDTLAGDVAADFVFSCPPYADLEVYSDNPADLSTMAYDDFVAAYREIIAKACAQLRDDRFACFVVGDVRDSKGIYRNFVGDTVQAFIDAGLGYYNEAVLCTPIGSLPLRAGKAFQASRKLAKAHQNVLVFVKGDPKRAAQACGDVDVAETLAALEGEAAADDDMAGFAIVGGG